MIKNVGKTDSIIRILIAIVIAILYFTNVISGTLGYILLAVGAIALITAMVGRCGLYYPLGLNTCKLKEKQG